MHSMGSGKTISGLMLLQNFTESAVILHIRGQDVTWKNELGCLMLTNKAVEYLDYLTLSKKLQTPEGQSQIRALFQGRIILADEAHQLAQMNDQQKESFQMLCKAASRIFLFTGTPMDRNMGDLGFYVTAVSKGKVHMPFDNASFLDSYGASDWGQTARAYVADFLKILSFLYTVPSLFGLKAMVLTTKGTVDVDPTNALHKAYRNVAAQAKTSMEEAEILKSLAIFDDPRLQMKLDTLFVKADKAVLDAENVVKSPINVRASAIIKDVLELIAAGMPSLGKSVEQVALATIRARIPLSAAVASGWTSVVSAKFNQAYLPQFISAMDSAAEEATEWRKSGEVTQNAVIPAISKDPSVLITQTHILAWDLVYMVLLILTLQFCIFTYSVMKARTLQRLDARKFAKDAGPYIDVYAYRLDKSNLGHFPVADIKVVKVPLTGHQLHYHTVLQTGELHKDTYTGKVLRALLHVDRGAIAQETPSDLFFHYGRAIGSIGDDDLWFLRSDSHAPVFRRGRDGSWQVENPRPSFTHFACPLFEAARAKVVDVVDKLFRCVVYSNFTFVMQRFCVFLSTSPSVHARYLDIEDGEDLKKELLAWINDSGTAEKRVLMLHHRYVESININIPSGMVILEPLEKATKISQLHARVLRYCSHPIADRTRPIYQLCTTNNSVLGSIMNIIKTKLHSAELQKRRFYDLSNFATDTEFFKTADEGVMARTAPIEQAQRELEALLAGVPPPCNSTEKSCEIWTSTAHVGTCAREMRSELHLAGTQKLPPRASSSRSGAGPQRPAPPSLERANSHEWLRRSNQV